MDGFFGQDTRMQGDHTLQALVSQLSAEHGTRPCAGRLVGDQHPAAVQFSGLGDPVKPSLALIGGTEMVVTVGR
jgi:hypothetical protein